MAAILLFCITLKSNTELPYGPLYVHEHFCDNAKNYSECSNVQSVYNLKKTVYHHQHFGFNTNQNNFKSNAVSFTICEDKYLTLSKIVKQIATSLKYIGINLFPSNEKLHTLINLNIQFRQYFFKLFSEKEPNPLARGTLKLFLKRLNANRNPGAPSDLRVLNEF